MDQTQQDGIRDGISTQLSNPWQGFAHPEHKAEEYESLLRTLRFAMIQLNKFWVEINAFPVFMNELKGASIREIERLFLWLQASPQWSNAVQHPRLIPELKQSALRSALSDFSDSVTRVRSLRAQMREIQATDLPDEAALLGAQSHLGVAIALARQLGLEHGRKSEVEVRISEVASRVGRNEKLRGFFRRLHQDCGMPEATCLREAARVFQAVDYVRKTRPDFLEWRKPQILGPNQRIRIEAWQDRAKPAIEARKRLIGQCKLEENITSERLRAIAAALKGGGTFRAFSTSYKEALKHYQELMKGESGTKGLPKESVEVMAERLVDWAGFLESKAQFEGNPEARTFFSPLFKGIDTDFATALAVNTWANALRSELRVEDPATAEGAKDAAFCAQIMEWVFTAPILKLQEAIALCVSAEVQTVQAILLENEYATGREFQVVGQEEQVRLLEATRLREAMQALALRAEIPLARLGDLRKVLEERLALVRRLNAWTEIRNALKAAFAGEDTELLPIESVRAYVEFIETAGLPESLRNSFLTAYGPARLADTRSLVAPAQNGLAAVKEHLSRLEVATYGQSKGLESEPLLDLIQRIQRALKSPQALGEWVDKLKSDARWKS